MDRVAAALALSVLLLRGANASALVCPLDIPAGTLTMACGAACPNALSPCLYYANASDCVAEADAGSVCVSSTLAKGNCAIECFSPFSGSASDAWNLMITTNAEYKRDVADRRAYDASFRLAKKNLKQLTAIRDLTFPSTAKNISISGDALPIIDKAVDYPVIYNGFSVNVDMGNFSFLENALNANAIFLENINLTALTAFPLLPKLTTLQLSNSKLRAIPKGTAKLPALQRLEVSLTKLTTIADGLLPMNLVDLCLQDSGLDELPSAIANMTRLRKLDLAGNKFPLPTAGSLPLQVEHLIWWGLYHQSLPPDFANMSKLKILEVGWNDFSDSSTLALLPPSLEELHLIDVLLTELPVSFAQLKKLTWIELGKNNVQRVVKGTLPSSLKFLNLSINYVAEIGAGALPASLETLDLRVNVLECSSFPADFASLERLTTLYLHDNYLNAVPPVIFDLKKLETLTLHHNGNMTRLTLNESQVAFFGKLKTFKIDQSCLETNCENPATIGTTNYTVCLTGDHTIGNKTTTQQPTESSGSDLKPLIIGLAVAIAGLLAILIGAVHWKRRRDAANNSNSVQPSPPFDGKSSLRPLGESEVHAIETQLRDDDGASDATAYADMKHYAKSTTAHTEATASHAHHKTVKTTKTTTTTTTTTSTTANSSTSRFSVWDDHELLQKRLEFAAIRDVELLSSGTNVEVWLAIYMSQHVAVKRLAKQSGDDASAERQRIERFAQEIKVHSRMNHPKIVKFIGVAWTMESDLQAVVEYMSMGDLRTFLSSLQPTFETLDDDEYDEQQREHHWDAAAIQIAIDVAEALVYLHSLKPPVLHRDLKSRNVLLDESLTAKATDFGISRYHFDDDTHVQLTTNLSTARWAAPEVLTGSDVNYTSAIDIYSFGVILSELDTWAVPFSEHVGVADAVLLSQVMTGALKPRFRSNSPRTIVALAESCLATDPKQRPTAVAVAYGLRQFLSQSETDQARVHGLADAARGSVSSRGSVKAVGAARPTLI